MLKPEDIKIGTLVTIDQTASAVVRMSDINSWNKFFGKVGEIIAVEHKEWTNEETGLKIIVCTVWWPQLNTDDPWFHGYLNKIQNVKT